MRERVSVMRPALLVVYMQNTKCKNANLQICKKICSSIFSFCCNTLQYPAIPCNIVQYPAIPCIAPKSCRTFAPELRRGLTQRNRARSADELRSMTLARVLAAPRQSSSKLGSALGLHNTCHCDINVDGGST